MVEAIILIVVLAVTVGILWLAKRLLRQTDLKPFPRSFTKQNYAIKTMETDYNF